MSTAAAAKTPSYAATPLLRRAAVLGAGAMGSRIAAHLANAGIPVVLLDIVPPAKRSRRRAAASPLGAVARCSRPNRRPSTKLRRASHHARQFRRRPRGPERLRLDHRSRLRRPRHQAIAARENRAAPRPEPSSPPTPAACPLRRCANTPPEFRRRWFGTHFLQSAALHAPAGDHPHGRSRPGSRLGDSRVRRSPPGQVDRLRARHSQLHRQPHRCLFHADRRSPDAGAKPHD